MNDPDQSKLADVLEIGAAELKRLKLHADNMQEWANKFQAQRDVALDQRDEAMELAERFKAEAAEAKLAALAEFETRFLLHHRKYAIAPAQIMALRELRAKYGPPPTDEDELP